MASVWVPLRQRVQSELIKRGYCVGCTRSLIDADRMQSGLDESFELVHCQCGRVFVYNKQLNSYRRATHEEWQHK